MDLKISYPNIKQMINPIVTSAKSDIRETVTYYKNNAQYGWERGRKLANMQKRNSITSFLIKAVSTAAYTKLRMKDIIPIIGCILFTFTNPIVGMGAVGFALGRAFNTQLSKGINSIKHSISKVKLK